MRVLTVGDIVGEPGVQFLCQRLNRLIDRHEIDFTVANAENAYRGSGITPKIVRDLYAAGVDVVTAGDHVWKRPGIQDHIASDDRLLRAVNHKASAPGRGFTIVRARNGVDVGVMHAIGRIFMPPIDCPFKAVEQAWLELRNRVRVIILDMHAEATSEKVAMGRFLDGRVSAVFGTHTHVPTADIQILPGGTGYITDVGMTGPYRSVLGRRIEPVLQNFLTGLPFQFEVASEDVRAGAAIFTIDPASGRCTAAERVEWTSG